jgi:hypothetical protein
MVCSFYAMPQPRARLGRHQTVGEAGGISDRERPDPLAALTVMPYGSGPVLGARFDSLDYQVLSGRQLSPVQNDWRRAPAAEQIVDRQHVPSPLESWEPMLP